MGKTHRLFIISLRAILFVGILFPFGGAVRSFVGHSLGPVVRPPTSTSRATLLRGFSDPPFDYGPVDCWWWEAGQLSREKMKWQLEDLKDKGVAGTWFYPRWASGELLSSDPPYWSEKWWDFTRFSMEEHRRLGLRHWFSDWTAHQFHQNRVRAQRETNPQLMGRRLVIYQRESDRPGSLQIEIPDQEEILDAAAYKKIGDRLNYSSREGLRDAVQGRQLKWKAPDAGWLLTVIAAQPHDLNYLDKAVVQRWIDSQLGEYERRLPEFVGKALTAYGPDELILLQGNILYSPSLIERIRSERAYDPSPYLVGLFHDIGAKTDQVRCDYYERMSILLEENFYRPVLQWLEERGMKYTTIATEGDLNPLEQTYQYGDFIRYMRWFHVTGNEDPFRTEAGERRWFWDSKLSSSIAHLYERERTAVCVYWRAGWGQTQEENLAWINENYAYGMNLYNQHGGLYTLMGGWYEWVPPAVDFYQPYWQYWKPFADYIRRLSYIMSQGKHRADVALIYPLTTIHANWIAGRASGAWSKEKGIEAFAPVAHEAAKSMIQLSKAIYRKGNLDLDFVDYPSLERARVEGNKLTVGGLEFRAVVLPALSTIRTATLEKIREFYETGGTVVAFGRLPGASAENGREDPHIRSLIEGMFGIGPGQAVSSVVTGQSERGGKAFFIPKEVSRVPDVISSAIVPDLVASKQEIFHTHQKIGDLDVYFLFNTKAEKRRVSFRFRVDGEPEIWNAFTGKVQPVHRFQRQEGATHVQLDMEPYEAVVLVFVSGMGRPAILEDNLSVLVQVEPEGKGLKIEALDEVGGRKSARLRYQGQEYAAEGQVEAPPPPIRLEGPFSFRLEPTMDNRWGDYRYPPSQEMIGAEARRFRYLEESNVTGTELGWHQANFDDSHWSEVTYSYGPYWWHIGPFQEGSEPEGLGSEPEGLLEKAKRGEVDFEKPWHRWMNAETSLRWEPYSFSQKFGHQDPDIHDWGGLLGVSENFLVFDRSPSSTLNTHYLFTSVYSPDPGDFRLYFGEPEKSASRMLYYPPAHRQAWVNGEEVIFYAPEQTDDPNAKEVKAKIRLKEGLNSVLLKVVQPEGQKVATYALILDSEVPPADLYVPRLRWFREPQKLIYDITPYKTKRVGWYRFKAPPGLQTIHLKTNARQVEAWVNGRAVPVREGRIRLESPLEGVSQVALRVEQERGTYAGAVFPEPVAFECQEGSIPLGDWSQYGLATYSGVGVYGQMVKLQERHLAGKVVLNLGQVKTVAEAEVNGQPAGIGMARPFRFDITDLVKVGDNYIEIKVANTLANHMSSYPTRWVLEGQTVSGLLGPVQLEFLSRASLTALPVN